MKSIVESIGIIGCGNMGSAIASALAEKGTISLRDMSLYDKDTRKRDILAEKTGCRKRDLFDLVKSSEILIVAIKPRDFDELAESIARNIRTTQTIVSVMAGIKIHAIAEKLGKDLAIARAMPNMSAFVRESMTCVSFNAKVQNENGILSIFASIGRVLEIEECFMDAVTALSGSGPAYFFYLADAMIKAGRETGLDKKIAEELVIQTFYGSAALMRDSGGTPEDLIEKVASKGGTTETALKVFDEKRVKDAVKEAVAKAKKRAEELSRG
ncbi:MAG: pyrroline-5-carboxylate reductase [Candidatus Omnitrophota bacterium]